ncbi:uncharacterized protein LOC114240356 isoform X2 [Bombyx mandarina]|uniref:Spaetzle domain-containing protein n=2 Tax=Bombyx TaxID=7090 RepID=A0A8R2G9I3_BOMMO|nr:uncharacterized protein LOC105841531 isoform X2 [Bombyx mori]XP_028026676.1 uncharacterized protein LOC114240356 isoform X2 [Bombyx mandarina]XP_037874356.1 uncharacterized protein LOC105841531 isoform X2 [Bombyx mori]
MRMASALPTLLAVLCGAVADAGDEIANVSRVRRAPHISHRITIEKDDMSWKRSHWREMQLILQQQGTRKDGQSPETQKEGVDCCPSVLEMVIKKGGRTVNGLYVELYEDGENKQRLFELTCAPGIVDMPCRFIDARLYNDSRCVQKYSYSYALVRPPPQSSATESPHQKSEGHFSVPGSDGWSMDYVKVRAGCECQIKPPKNTRKRHKKRKRNRRIVENDET